MIISKTPYRVSFFGGGSDYPQWYNKFGGSVLSATIDKHIYISCRFLPGFFEHKYRIVWSKIENVNVLRCWNFSVKLSASLFMMHFFYLFARCRF